jgi:hypothetical protein
MARARSITDVATLWGMWHDPTTTVCEIARTLCVSETTVRATARSLGLHGRTLVKDGSNVEPEVDSEEDAESYGSLRLAPSVAAAAAEVRSRWSDVERYQRRVQKVQPVVVQSFSFARCEQ